MSVSDWLSKGKTAVDMMGVLVAAFELLAEVVKHATSKEQKLKTLEDVVRNVQAGWKGDMSAAAIRAEFDKMRAGTKTGDAADKAADAAADDKFGPKS